MTTVGAQTNMGFVPSDQALVHTVWHPAFAKGFIVSAGLPDRAQLGMTRTSDLFI